MSNEKEHSKILWLALTTELSRHSLGEGACAYFSYLLLQKSIRLFVHNNHLMH